MKKGQNIKSSMVQWHSNTAIKEVTDSMEKRPSIKSMIGLGLLAVAAVFLAMLLTEAPAQGAVNCTNDLDCDGLTDTEETNGIALNGGTFPSCVGTSLDRLDCVDPNTPDLFVILLRQASTNIPADPLVFVHRPQAEGGLGIATHEITLAQAGVDPGKPRSVTLNQNAVQVTESLNTSGEILGVANYGTPNGLDRATVYTQRIINHVTSVYGGATPPDGLIDTYILHTIAHEIAHMLTLTGDYNKRFGGYHFKTGSGVVLDQSVKYTVKGNKVTFYIGTVYSDQSKAGATLK
ncbi:MAG: hypothetical protein ACYSTI_11775 [Planctomycetota bacterium]